MKPVSQKDLSGCAIACVAFILDVKYAASLKLFKNGQKKAYRSGFSRREIVEVLNKAGLKYSCKYISNKTSSKRYKDKTIVFIKRSKNYPMGHYLCRAGRRWMDPWVNIPKITIKAGYRRRLPEKPIYAIYQLGS